MTMTDKEWILHFFYIYLLKIEKYKFIYLYDINECLDETMSYLNSLKDNKDLLELKEAFIEVMQISYQLFKGDGFRFKEDEALNINLFETLSYLYMILDKDIDMNDLKIKIEDLKDDVKEMEDFFNLDLKENQFRFEMVEDLKDNDD